jgi:hypothetical protein
MSGPLTSPPTPGSLPDIPVYAVTVNPRNHSQVFVGTEIGFYYTDNINAPNPNWQRFQTGMPVTPIYKLTIDTAPDPQPHNTVLVAWTYGRGAYATPLPQYPPTWPLVPSPNVGTQANDLQSVASVSPTDGWAVGSYYDNSSNYNKNLILRWDGSSWHPYPSTPNPGTRNNFLFSVSAGSATDVWAVGISDSSGTRPTALHWDSSQWTNLNAGLPNTFVPTAVVDKQGQVWIVGGYYPHSGYAQTFAALWNGSSWTPLPGLNHNEDCTDQVECYNVLTGVSTLGLASTWAVGYFVDPVALGGVHHYYTQHWDGTAWSFSEIPGGEPNAIIALAANNIWLVGSQTVSGVARTLVEHNDGTGWSIVPNTPNIGAMENQLVAVAAVSPTDLWAVGSYNTFGGYLTLVLHGDGTNWTVTASGDVTGSDNDFLNAVSVDSTNDDWAVGYSSCPTDQTLVLQKAYGPFLKPPGGYSADTGGAGGAAPPASCSAAGLGSASAPAQRP